MKRPQFGLRLMMLVVMLASTVLAWRRSVAVRDRTEREGLISLLQWKIAGLERSRDAIYEQLPLNMSFDAGQYKIESEIEIAKKQLNSISR